jgi:hypothetical protein
MFTGKTKRQAACGIKHARSRYSAVFSPRIKGSEKPFNTQTDLCPLHQKAVTVRLIFIKRWGKKLKKSDKLRLKTRKKKEKRTTELLPSSMDTIQE